MAWFEIIIVLICSFILGSIAGLPIIFIEKSPMLDFMLKGGFIGICIGCSNIAASLFFYKILKTHKLFFSYLALIIISAVGTFTGAYAFGLKKIQYLTFLVILSEIISILFSISIHRYKEKLNSKLRDKQKDISNQLKELL